MVETSRYLITDINDIARGETFRWHASRVWWSISQEPQQAKTQPVWPTESCVRGYDPGAEGPTTWR